MRPPANFPLPGGYAAYEGIVETDRWFGPLFANLRLARTGVPIVFDPDLPLLQVQPLPRSVLDEATQNDTALVAGPADFAPSDWQDYERSIVRPALDPAHRPGGYAAAARKRARCPLAAMLGRA